jgi:hypothetical protein
LSYGWQAFIQPTLFELRPAGVHPAYAKAYIYAQTLRSYDAQVSRQAFIQPTLFELRPAGVHPAYAL